MGISWAYHGYRLSFPSGDGKDKDANRAGRPQQSQVCISHGRIKMLWQFEAVVLICVISKNIILVTDSMFSRATNQEEMG